MSEPRIERIGNQRLILGDCLEVLPALAAGSVDAVITDPPYGTGNWKRATAGAGSDPTTVYCREAWDEWSAEWLSLALCVASRFAVFCPQSRIGELQSVLSTQRLFLWVKSDPRPRFQGQPAYGFEPIVVGGSIEPVGGPDYLTASAPRLNRDSDGTGHPHQKPIAVVKWMVTLVSAEGGTICDPFMGSGTTLVAAELLGRRGIGIEICPEYYEIALRRVEKAVRDREAAEAQGQLDLPEEVAEATERAQDVRLVL